MLQVRITDADGTNPVILDRAENKSYYKSVTISDEGISFEISKNSPKADVLNPDTTGYKKFWEVWNTRTNRRLNYGPITEISEDGPNWKVGGLGRSSLLNNFYKTTKTFYYSLDSILDDLRFENVAIQPRTTTLVSASPVNTTIFGSQVVVDSKYLGLSTQTKDNAIDDDSGIFKPGQVEPPNTYFTTNSYWSGMSKKDTHIIDLGGTYHISKINLLTPWWGGSQKLANRAYDFALDYGTDTEGTLTNYQGRDFGTWHEIYNTPNNNLLATNTDAYKFYIGTVLSGTSVEYKSYYIAQNVPGPIDMRYIRTRIRDVHAWYGSIFDNVPAHDSWDFQCNPNYNPGDDPLITGRTTPHGIMEDKPLNDRVLEPANDCNAALVEVGAYQEIIPRDDIQPLALQRIDNSNLQITYHHITQSTDTVTTTDGFRKFEPGGFFRKFQVTYTGANTIFNRFFSSDCVNCFPDGYKFGIMDQNNSLIYATDSASGTNVAVDSPAYSSLLLMKGSNDAYVSWVDSWKAVTDPFSYNTSYSFTEMANDWASVHFRGQSFKWYATVPADKTGANVKIEIRSKSAPNFTTEWTTAAWSAWSTLVATMPLTSGISAELVYEISYESGTLLPDTVYEIKITNLDGGYCSIDSFEGYWSGSLTSYNEDNHRIRLNDVARFNQIYDKRFSSGSMYKVNKSCWIIFNFVGDRIVIYSAKGRNHGKIRIVLLRAGPEGSPYDAGIANKINIPGSDANRNLIIDLGTGKRGNEIPQFVAFDSNDYFVNGLPWDRYILGVYHAPADIQTFTTTDAAALDNFVGRCEDCNPPTGSSVTINKPIFFDGVSTHELLGLSVSFEETSHLDILKSVAEAVQIEPDITDEGLLVKPRLGRDTDEVLREGQNTVVHYQIVNDISQVASMLLSYGADIDGLPLFTITEDKKTREDLGRTVMRKEDFRDVASYFQLVGLSRTSLRKRKKPEKRISVSHVANDLVLEHGDSFILYTKKMGPIRVRIVKKTIAETSSGGTTFELECIRWPLIM